jgi:OTT_1508-like deaminase
MPADFYHLLTTHANAHGMRVPGQRRDWIAAYPKLKNWEGEGMAAETLHCEVKLGMHLLTQDKWIPEIAIGVSKDPCFACEAWYDGLNACLLDWTFHLEPGHCKAYAGWKPSGVAEGDANVVRKVWEHVDRMIEKIQHSERRDFVPSLMATPPPTQFTNLSKDILKGLNLDM